MDKNNKLICEWHSSDEKILNGKTPKLIDFNGTHVMKPIFYNVEAPYEVTLCVISYIVDENNKIISNKDKFSLILQGVDISTYEYVFIFDDNSLYKELEWEENDLDKKYVNVITKKQHYINGIFDCEYEIPFKYKLNNDDFDVNFSMNIQRYDDNDNVEKFFIYPNMDNCNEENVIKQYTLIQKESEKELQLNLIQHPKSNEIHKDIKLSVMVKCDKIGEEDYWTDEESKLLITDVTNNNILIKEIPLSKCWLYHGIEENGDYVYKGKIDLIVGHQYKFKTEGFIAIQTTKGEIYNVYLNETYEIEDDDEGIDLIIKI